MTKFDELKAEHQRLLAEHDAGGDEAAVLVSAQNYIESIRVDAEQVPDPRDRDQLRSYLRFWGAYVYDRTGTYPESSLRPALQVEKPRRKKWDWRWALGGAILLIVVAFIFGSSLFFVSNRNASLEFSKTPIAKTATQAPGAVEATETVPQPSPSSTPLSASPTPSPTSIPIATSTPTSMKVTPGPSTATVAVLLTQAAEAATREVEQIITAIPTVGSEGPLIPETGGGGGGFLGTLVDAEVRGVDGWDWCTSGLLEVNIEDPKLVFDDNATLTLWVDPAGSQRFLRQEITVDQPKVLMDLANLGGTDTYALLHLEHPQFPSKDVIFHFSSACKAERLLVTYRATDEWLSFEEEPPRNQNLSLVWRLVTWGPEPMTDNQEGRWVATLDLGGQGGDGSYIYWKSNDYGYLDITENTQVLIRGWACSPGSMVVGVTSAGQSLARQIVLQAPYCLESMLTP